MRPLWQVGLPAIGGGYASLANLDAQLRETFLAPLREDVTGKSILVPGALLDQRGDIIEDRPRRKWISINQGEEP